MTITIGILQETAEAEARVATTPDMVKKFRAAGSTVIVETGAGMAAGFTDAAYTSAGADIAPRDHVIANVQLLLAVQIPGPEVITALKPGTVVAGFMPPHRDSTVQAAVQGNITLLGMEYVPRITRAQSLDALSSQANLAGYRAVIEAAGFYNRAMPMMMTAAGTIAPAKVLVMGAGVAGLQAIATARRLGAVVSATDVRMAAKEQVQSLGAKFVMVEDEETRNAETTGGYAREMSDAYKAKQAALIAETIAKQDIVITTAQIPGRPAPRLVTTAMIETMKPGSVIVDVAASSGGNVEGTVPGEVVIKNGVVLVGYQNLPARIPQDASNLYARNLWTLYGLLVSKESDRLVVNLEDEILKAMVITHQGQIIKKG